jgi:hypothetical protein
MPARRYEKTRSIVTREIQDEVVIVPVHNDVAEMDWIYSLNPMGRLIWTLLDEGEDVDAIVRRICAEHQVSDEVARGDVETFLATLAAEGLLQEVAS